MQPSLRDLIVFAVAGAAGLFITQGAFRMVQSPSRGLPYHDDFAGGDASEWIAYDGNWNVQSGVMVNESNERGAKLVTGSPYWTNYAMDADIALSNTGDAGIIARVSDAEPGVDAYSGIYVGLRVRDESLVIGVADHGWHELEAKDLPHPIESSIWYHIRLEISGCNLRVFTWQGSRNDAVRLDESLTPCPKRGKIGLRSYDSGGQWKNIRVTELSDRAAAF
ncbi:MAG TPA: family 16 glycoside hydrolase [Acidobacteriaceae bacterium]|nr:family 16 glycoside hydrolase [Acidobacteriaceae bacterium]